MKNYFAVPCVAVLLVLSTGIVALPALMAQEPDRQESRKVVQLRTLPTPDTKTMPSSSLDAGTRKFELTEPQKEFYDSAAARMAAKPDTSSEVYLDFLSDDDAGPGFAKRTGFAFRDGEMQNKISNGVFPVPLGRQHPRWKTACLTE